MSAGTELAADNKLTLVDIAKSRAPDGSHIPMVEVLHQKNSLLEDWVWGEANGTLFHKVSRRASLGDGGTWRLLNKGVPITSTKKLTINEAMGILEDYAESDKWIVDNAASPMQERMDQAAGILEGMSQTLVATMLYGNSDLDSEKFTGLAPRLNDTDQINVLSGGGSSTLTSIYAVGWGKGRVWMAFPKGSPTVGIVHEDLGEVTLTDATTSAPNTSQYQGYRDHFVVNGGMVVEDDRWIGRYCNINSTVGESNNFDEDKLTEMLDELPDEGASGVVLYAPKKIFTQMKIRLSHKANVNFTMEQGFGGRRFLAFQGVPVRKVDQITYAETQVTS